MMIVLLSLFPGIGLLDRAFEETGFCVVRGPDLIWGGNIRTFHPPAGVFAGVIGGPPCQGFSQLVHLVRHNGYTPRFGNLIPEFERCIAEAGPEWFLMENVPGAPIPTVEGYAVQSFLLNNRWVGGEQLRTRRISFGDRLGRQLQIDVVALEPAISYVAVKADNRPTRREYRRADLAVHGSGNGGTKIVHVGNYSIERMCELQGLPADFTDLMPFTMAGKKSVIGNGVPLPMGRAMAHAIRRLPSSVATAANSSR